jgi:hypothetical protein
MPAKLSSAHGTWLICVQLWFVIMGGGIWDAPLGGHVRKGVRRKQTQLLIFGQ